MLPQYYAGQRAYTDVWSCSHSHFSHFQLLLVAAEKTLLLRGGGGEVPRVFWLNKSKGLFSLLFWMLGSHLFVYEPRNQRSLGQQDQ